MLLKCAGAYGSIFFYIYIIILLTAFIMSICVGSVIGMAASEFLLL